MKILKSTDRVKVKIGDVSLIMSPMKQAQKLEMSGLTKVKNGEEISDVNGMISYVVKNCVKGLEGVTDYDDKPIELTFDVDGTLSEDSHSDVMGVLSESRKHIDALLSVAKGSLPAEINDFATGKKVKGAEVTVNPKI